MARGEGQGTGGAQQGDGGAAECVCPQCGYTITHLRGIPCANVICPNCDIPLTGK